MADYNDRMAAVDAVLAEVRAEVERAVRKHRPMNSPHEGYAVIKEELDELWDEVKGNRGRELSALEEAVQVAAMGVRYVADLSEPSQQRAGAAAAQT
jgi:hypothetical protein